MKTPRPSSTRYVFVALTALGLSNVAGAAETPTGEQIFRQRCAVCHGMAGEGIAEKHPQPLQGDRNVKQLSRFIARSMPKDAETKCTPEEAEKVAVYIHDAFYSKDARERNRPARVELSRLTVTQYRNAIADLIGTFRGPGRWDETHGLRAEYFKSRRLRQNERVLDRIDPTVRFDFGTSSPDDNDKLSAREFSIRWQGALLAPETGEYEFILRTDHAARLWLNDMARPLIDASVKSGNDLEHRAAIFLLAGRPYPLRLEFSKAKQGVDDSAKTKNAPPVKAEIALEWKLPGRAAEVIPQRQLAPQGCPETFVAKTAFPPDDRSVGWERGTSISQAWDQATTDAALEVAAYVVPRLRELSGVPDGAPDRAKRLCEFCQRFAERAFRRPLTDEQKQFFTERQFQRAPDADTAVKRVVLLVLKSPRFLFREVAGGRDPYDVASRLSFGLWDSLPDAELLKAAADGQLATREQVVRQAERMVRDLRSRAKLRSFFMQWLKVEPAPDLAKDRKRYPDFDPALVTDLRTSLELFLDDVAWSEASDFRQLLLADSLYLNGRLAQFYGADLPADAPFQKVALEPKERAGVLSHPYLTAVFAYTASSSPIHRGVFLVHNVLGRTMRPPPDAFTPLAAELHPDLSTRERVTLQTKPGSCQACHGVINSLGFTLEHFDAVGRYRDKDNGRPIDATGSYQTGTGAVVKFNGVRDLATFLAGSDEVQTAFVEKLFHHLVKQPIGAFGPRVRPDLRQSFAQQQYSIRRLMVDIMAASALPAPQAKP